MKTYPQNNGSIEEQKLRYTSYFYFSTIHIFYYFSYREAYEKAKEQLKRGEEMMESLMFPLADCGAWRHSAMFCFPQIESREVFAEKLHLSDTELKVGVKGCRSTVEF